VSDGQFEGRQKFDQIFNRVSGLFEFSTPVYFVRDPKLLKKLAVKDFDSFADHKNFLSEEVDPLFGRALFSLQGKKWRGV
jgi:cytochrome P450 family 9